MKNKKLLILILFMFCIDVFYNSSVSATPNTDAKADSGGVGSCSGYTWCWEYEKKPSGGYMNGVVNAMRVSFYDKNGTKYGQALDFINTADTTVYNTFINKQFKMSESKKTKIDYAKEFETGGYSPVNLSAIGFANAKSLDFINFLTVNGYSTTNVFEDNLGITEYNDLENLFRPFESSFGISFDEIKEHKDKYYIVIEPATVIYNTVENVYYYGTYTELLALYRAGTPGINILFKGNGYTLAKSIYLNGSVGSNSGSFSSYINRLSSNDNINDFNNKYGIGVLWINDIGGCDASNPLYDASTGKCEPPSNEFKACEVLEPVVDPCATGNGNAISYEYKNCPLDNDTANYIRLEYNSSSGISYLDVAKIECDEKYRITTFQLKNDFQTIPSTNLTDPMGVLAGTYYSINGPVVYHKKTCRYVSDLSDVRSRIDDKIEEMYDLYYDGCKVPDYEHAIYSTTGELIDLPYKIDESCKNDWESKYNDMVEKANELKEKYNNLIIDDNKVDLQLKTSYKDSVHTGIDYELTPISSEIENLTDSTRWGYKTTHNYGLKQNGSVDINRYISMEKVFDSQGTESIKKVYDLGKGNITTTINLKGVYNYYIDYNNIFSSSFKDIIRDYSTHDISTDTRISKEQCPYSIIQRNIKNFCTPNSSNSYCGNPNLSFNTPKINMIYRPISLNNPFPGKDGNNRTPGINWSSEDVVNYITQNRKIAVSVNPETIYTEKEALYVINLDSSTIKQIRDYNDSNQYDNFDLECTDGKGTECLSNFLRSNDLITGGRCKDATDIDSFYECADK